MQTATKNSNPLVDWAAVRQDYENTTTSAAALAKKYGVSPAGITYHANRASWKRPAEYTKHHASLKPASAKLKAPPVLPELELSADGAMVVHEVGATHLTAVPISDDIEALAALRHRIISQHKVSISRDMAYLDVLEKGLMEKKSAPLQKLNALRDIVKIRATLVELERQAHSIVGGVGEKQQTNIQVNVNVTPQDAYRALIEGK